MHWYRSILAGLIIILIAAGGFFYLRHNRVAPGMETPEGFIGSASCQDCHQEFYERWAPSRHGLAMQSYTPEFAQAELTPQSQEIVVGEYLYRAEITGSEGWVSETGPQGEQKKWPIEHVMGGKNVYYFLTPMDRGRLQVLPVAYDARRKQWYDTQASAVRHFGHTTDEPLHWSERPYTFNTSCYSCHVSQLTKNYNPESDTYHTVWAEPGINCETCHGPAAEHVRFCEESEEACTEDVRIIKTGDFSAGQTNSMCAPCHAKMIPITDSFRPGERFFDHYDLATLEDRDFYPDGRDLGENYTYTLWLTSPCVKSGELDCQHCHTSSGRFRFTDDEANQACMPCHEENVSNPEAHTHHPEASAGGKCIACHMPVTEFARMRRSDHSMRPPTPEATIEFKSPNACNLCHTDRDAAWANKNVRQWRQRDYQAPVLHRAGLINAARDEDWSRLAEMLAYLESEDRDQVYAKSLILLLHACEDDSKWPVILKSLNDPSPLVRASAAVALSGRLTPDVVSALVEATRDEYRLVRIRAAAALAVVPQERLNPQDLADVKQAEAEFIIAMTTRPDDAISLTNLGNFYMDRRDLEQAIGVYETAIKFQPDNIVTRVNASLAYNMAGRNKEAEESLRAALQYEPKNAAANFNLGLLLGGMGRQSEAKRSLQMALETEPGMAAAAYNLCILESEDNLGQAIEWCRKAAESRPSEPRYAYALAFHQQRAGRRDDAVAVLQELIIRYPDYSDAQVLLNQLLR